MHKLKKKQGLTIPELMIAAAILVFSITAILFSYLTCLNLSSLSRNSSLALQAAKSKMEEIRTFSPYSQIKANYNGVSFVQSGFNGRGISYVDDSNPDLLVVTVSFSWIENNKRVIGEDKDLDGAMTLGEDTNANGKLDSIVELTTYIYNR